MAGSLRQSGRFDRWRLTADGEHVASPGATSVLGVDADEDHRPRHHQQAGLRREVENETVPRATEGRLLVHHGA